MKNLFFVMIMALGFESVGFCQNATLYSITLSPVSGTNTIKLSDYKGKKILLVNSATHAGSINQFASLEKLFQQFKDSGLVIIVCPSNSFGNEPGSNEDISQFIQSHFTPGFIITSKIEILGEGAHALYKWISSKEQNGLMNGKIQGDFTKFLINEQGQIKGFYSAYVDPLDPVIINAIHNN